MDIGKEQREKVSEPATLPPGVARPPAPAPQPEPVPVEPEKVESGWRPKREPRYMPGLSAWL